ncbi:MAG: cyclic nucleotide-binding domain-containing protein [Desulfobacterales bacterium]|nr:cyclic nucleotide-binding domain-containing protein [Desulfobacterales bacterium]MDD3951324.1 cyclic nucleotide-binding domain-containing protein [Desulfobacterales bacterium]
MLKSYVIFEKGLVETLVFYLKDRLTFGRSPENDIQTGDPQVANFHSEIRYEDGYAVLEDFGSPIGTLLNGDKIRKSMLSHNDQIRIGDMAFRFFQEEVSMIPAVMDAQSLECRPEDLRNKTFFRRSSRLAEAISNIPLFGGLDAESISGIIQQSRMLIFEEDQMIFRQGDSGKFLYIVLDGRVQIFLQGRNDQLVPLAVLAENQFFGEISFLTGHPRSASVRALENTLLCEISADTLRDVVHRWPSIKHILNSNYQQRMADTAEKKRKAGIRENRGAPRYNLTLPLSFTLDEAANAPTIFKNTVHRFLSKNISTSGICIRLNNRMLAHAVVGCKLNLEVVLPEPWKVIRCGGIAVKSSEDKSKPAYGFLHVAFRDMDPDCGKTLEDFLTH